MKNKGNALLIILLAIAGAAAVAGGGYAAYKSGIFAGEEQEVDIYENVQEEQAALRTMMDYVKDHENDIYTEEQQEQDLDKIQKEVRLKAEELLNKPVCQASLEDTISSLTLAADAYRAGLGVLGDQLMTWTRAGYTYHVSTVASSWTNSYTDEILYDWAYHAQFAGMLGLENLFDMIIHGKIDLSGWLSENCGTTKDQIIGSPPDTLIAETLAQNFCKADVETIRQALKVMSLAQKLGRDRDTEIWTWAQNGFKAYVQRNYADWKEMERSQNAALSMGLGMEDLADQIINDTVDLEDWYEDLCTANGPFTIRFPNQTYVQDTVVKGITTTAYITDVKAYTCKGIYSQWHGTQHVKIVMVDPYQEKILTDDDGGFPFTLSEGDPKLNGMTVTMKTIPPITGHFSGPETIKGTIVRGAAECQR
ncbi:MAG: hypothetical protein WC243_00850 [Patescibacteria group bacterium]|jgi:hypothetical protein